MFGAKYKKMELRKQDLDRSDFYQIHSYIQYYSPNVLFGGLIYPLSKQPEDNNYYADSLFENEEIYTGFIVDGFYVNNEMTAIDIIENEKCFLKRIENLIIKSGI